jgi:hypothetical protein
LVVAQRDLAVEHRDAVDLLLQADDLATRRLAHIDTLERIAIHP